MPRFSSQSEAETLQRMFDKFLDKMLAFKRDNCCELVPVPEYSGVVALCRLFSALATPENGVGQGHSRCSNQKPPFCNCIFYLCQHRAMGCALILWSLELHPHVLGMSAWTHPTHPHVLGTST